MTKIMIIGRGSAKAITGTALHLALEEACVSVSEYNELMDELITGEIGTICGCRIVPSDMPEYWPVKERKQK